MMITIRKLSWFVCLLALASGCGTGRPKPDAGDPSQAAPLEMTDSGIDISYVLGHNRHRLLVQTRDSQIVAQSYLEKQILKENRIDRDRYADFLKKTKIFVENPKRNPADQELCRSPFTVTLRIGKDSKAISGCRSTDEGALSHLVREAEFLLYSKK